MPKVFVAVTLAILLTAALAQGEEQAYAIRLNRPSKVGESFRVVANSRHLEKVALFVAEVPVKTKVDEFHVELTGTFSALEVAGNGNVSKGALLVEKFMFTSGGETKPFLPSGTTIAISVEGDQSIYRINDVPVDAQREKVLRSVLSGASTVGPSDDEAFGTKEKQRVGDTWQANHDLLVKSLYEKGKMSIDAADIASAVTLQGIVKGGPRDYLVIGGQIQIGQFTLPLPQEFKEQKGKLEIEFSGRFPVNEDRSRIMQSLRMTASFAAIGPADSTLRGVFEDTRNTEFEEIN